MWGSSKGLTANALDLMIGNLSANLFRTCLFYSKLESDISLINFWLFRIMNPIANFD